MENDGILVPLRRLAHGRTGDKGNRCSISACPPLIRMNSEHDGKTL